MFSNREEEAKSVVALVDLEEGAEVNNLTLTQGIQKSLRGSNVSRRL